MVQVSEDIFYQVKKEILDKLDIILQKINLEIISYLHPQEEEFSFIELSSFQYEITHLFHYLDRLYASLNSSVSFSSVHSKCSIDCHAQNQRLAAENDNLHRILVDLQNLNSVDFGLVLGKEGQPPLRHRQYQNEVTFERKGSQQSINLQQLKQNVRGLMEEFKCVGKDVKKMLKKFKYQLLQSRVGIISKLKDFEFERAKERDTMGVGEMGTLDNHLDEDGQEVLHKINQILSLC